MVLLAHRDHERVSPSTQLLESGDQASCLCSDGTRIAIKAGIDHRAMRSLDQIHKRVPKFRKLTIRRREIANRHHETNGEGLGGRNVIKLPTRDALRQRTESSLIALGQRREARPEIGTSDLRQHERH